MTEASKLSSKLRTAEELKYLEVNRRHKAGETQKEIMADYDIKSSGTISKWVTRGAKLLAKMNGEIPSEEGASSGKTDSGSEEKKSSQKPPLKSKSTLSVMTPEEILKIRDATLNRHKKEIANLVDQAPINVRPLVQTLVEDFFLCTDARLRLALFKEIKTYLKDVDQLQKSRRQVIPYRRPTWLAPKQKEIADIVQTEKNLSLDGDRQTGKDSAVAVGKFEWLTEKQREQPLFFMASKLDTAREIIKKILREKRFAYILPHILSQYKDKVVFASQDGGSNELILIDTTEAAVKGITGPLWMDDIDTMIKEHKQDVITKAIMITRSNKSLNVVFTSNMGKGAYITLLNVFHKFPNHIKCISLVSTDVPHIDETTDEFLYATATALSGEGEAKAQLKNIYNTTGDTFDEDSINRALNRHETYLKSNPLGGLKFTETVLGIDPSGTGHPFGWAVWSKLRGWPFLRESGEIKMGEPIPIADLKFLHKRGLGPYPLGTKWLPHIINVFLIQKAVVYNTQKGGIVCESNSGGAGMVLTFNDALGRGMALKQNWEGDKNIDSHENFIRVVRHLLDTDNIMFGNATLANQWQIYQLKSTKEQEKGDMADASIHAIWKLMGGRKFLKYIESQLKQQMLPATGGGHYGKAKKVAFY